MNRSAFVGFSSALLLGLASLLACSSSSNDPLAAGGDTEQGATGPTQGSGSTAGSTAGSNGGSATGGAGAGGSLPCDVQAVLAKNCQGCHGAETQFGASAPLVSHANLHAAGPGASANRKVYELVLDRIKNDARPMPPVPNARLSAADVSTLEKWVEKGAPAGTEQCSGVTPPADPITKPLSCTPDQHIKAAKPFVMQPGAPLDQYVCFGFDVNVTKKRHVIALGPQVDNKKILHHILLFQTNTAESPEPTSCAAFGSAAWRLVAGWAPGGTNYELPAEAGFPEKEGTTHWVMQLHYNNALNLPNQTDNSGYDLCTTDQLRPNDAGVLGFGSINFNIPARAKHSVTCDYRLPNTFQNVKFFSASPHMHTIGRSMSTYRLPGGNGAPEKVFDQANFSFENQAAYPVSNAVQPGDVIRTKCGWDNTTDQQVGFGEGTGDEMCFDFIGYYPAIPDRTFLGLPIFTWITPSQGATCTAGN